jgi:hypothetical protein
VLTIEFNYDSHVLEIFRSGYFPRLVDFRAVYFANVAWSDALLLDFFPQLERLSITGSVGLIRVPMIIERLHRVKRLYLDGCSDLILRELLKDPSGSCPALRSLSVDHVDTQLLLNYVSSRFRLQSQKIVHIHYRHFYDLPLPADSIHLANCRGIASFVPKFITDPPVL